MEALEKENSNDSTGKIKEKVKVVALDDSSIIANTMGEFSANSNSSVWSLCGLNSDDNHVDLGDISPSISPIFTEQQMADHLTQRLITDDHIFSGENHASVHSNKSDLESDLELFDREMKNLESLHESAAYISKKKAELGKSEGDLSTKQSSVVTRRSPRKRALGDSNMDTSSIATRTRNTRHTQKSREVKSDTEKDVKSKKESKDQGIKSQCDVEQNPTKIIDEKVIAKNEIDPIKDGKNVKEEGMNAKEEKVDVSSSVQVDVHNKNEQNKMETEGTKEKPAEAETTTQLHSPDKRLTRSRTGNLKPKQNFDEIQEKNEKEELKRKEEIKKMGAKKEEKPKPKKLLEKETEKLTVSDDKKSDDGEPSSSDGEVDFHEDDSDYSPEDDPDRPWCICRKPHGNKFMICCDGCEEWFHGKCVGITMQQGRAMEKQGKEYVCDKCRDKKAKELMAEKAKELSDALKSSARPDSTHEEHKKPKPQRKISSSNVVAEPDSSEKPGQPTAPPEERKKKVKEPGFRIPKKVRTTPTPVSHSHVQAARKCIVEGCPRMSFEGAVYCGKSCIERHVSEAVRMLASKEHGGKLHTSEGNRVCMIEKSSGRLVAGMAAPVVTNLTEWILKNPSFQVLVSGVTSPTSASTTSFYSKVTAESKQKKESDKKNEVETVRSNVRRMMKDILVERKKESSEIRISVEEIMKMVSKIEDDMYKAFKDTSHRYKAKYRTLMFNLKDPRNKVLYKRVLTGDIPPDKLIHMTSDELATKELAQWREQETKHMIDMIRKEEEISNKARFIKKTHKGEVDMDGDEDFSTLEVTNIKEEEEKKPKPEEKVEVLSILDTTEEHRAHLFDLNCKICTGKMAPPGEVVAKSPTMSSVPIQAAAESSIPSPLHDTYTEPLSPDDRNSVSRETPSESSYSTEKVVKETPVWKGFVMMPSVAKFGTNAYLVSGFGDNLIQVLPDTLHVHGRIAHKHVWDYVKQCKTSSSRDLCIIRFVASTDEEKISYVSLYSYFHSRKRCGVIGNCHSGVKDMYLVPLASHEPIPPQVLPFTGPGLQEPRPHMLLGLIVKNKNVPVKRSRVERVPKAQEPPTKRTSIDSKSSTPSSQPTPAKPSDSPVDEIEDIVFHYHNSQGTKPQPAKPAQPQAIPPMISALLKIQEQEQRLRELQKQSEILEKELAPKITNVAASVVGQTASSTIGNSAYPAVANVGGNLPYTTNTNQAVIEAGNLTYPVKSNQPVMGTAIAPYPSTGQQSVASSSVPYSQVVGTQSSNAFPTGGVSSSTLPSAEDEPYDPEAEDMEETPYDPEDLDIEMSGLDEVPSPDKTSLTPSSNNAVIATQSTIPANQSQTTVSNAIPVNQNLPAVKSATPVNQSLTAVNTNAVPVSPSLAAVKTSALPINPILTGIKDAASFKGSFINTFTEPDSVKPVNNQPEIPGTNNDKSNTQHAIPKELEQKVQALLKTEKTSQPANQVTKTTPEAREQFGGVARAELERGHVRAPYHHSRDFPERREFSERRDFHERRDYRDGGRDDPAFYSSRYSLNARRGSEGHDRGGERQEHYRARDREDDRHWDHDRGRRDEYFNRNRDRSRDRWRR